MYFGSRPTCQYKSGVKLNLLLQGKGKTDAFCEPTKSTTILVLNKHVLSPQSLVQYTLSLVQYTRSLVQYTPSPVQYTLSLVQYTLSLVQYTLSLVLNLTGSQYHNNIYSTLHAHEKDTTLQRQFLRSVMYHSALSLICHNSISMFILFLYCIHVDKLWQVKRWYGKCCGKTRCASLLIKV